jgi:hypothetical protein
MATHERAGEASSVRKALGSKNSNPINPLGDRHILIILRDYVKPAPLPPPPTPIINNSHLPEQDNVIPLGLEQ